MSSSSPIIEAKKSNRISRWLWAALIGVAVWMVVRLLAPDTLGEQARRHFLAKLRSHYSEYEVTIGRGRFDSNVGLIFEDLVIRDPRARLKPLQEMVRIDQFVVHANIHPEKLIDKEVPLTTSRIVLSGVNANMILDDAGESSLSRLLPLPKLGPECPRIEISRARVNWFDASASHRPIATDFDEIVVENHDRLDTVTDRTITAMGSGDWTDAFRIQSRTVDDTDDIRFTLRSAQINRNLIQRLPLSLRKQFAEGEGLQCVCDVSASIYSTPSSPINYRIRTTVHDGSFSHSKLPKPLTNLRGVLAADPNGIRIEASHASLGEAVLRVNGEVKGITWPSDVDLHISTSGLLLDDQFSAILPESARSGWDQLQPQGRVDVNADVSCRFGIWEANAQVLCKGVDVRFEKFPYPVQQLVGRIDILGGIASSEALTGRIDSHRMQCAFRLPIRPGITNEKTFVVAADGPVTIDSTLIKSLTPRGQSQSKLESFVRSLRPRGSIHLVSAMFGTDASGRTTRQLDLRIIDGHLRYEKFAYPLYNVDGQIEINDDLVRMVGFRGLSANSGIVRCEGTYRIPKPSADPNLFRISDSGSGIEVPPQLALAFQATSIPMDDSLRVSLPESAQHTWDALAPGGVLDEADVWVTQQENGDLLQIDLTARQLPSSQVNNRTLSIRPCSLPYRIDITSGTVRYDGSKIFIDSLNGQHAATRLATDGYCVKGASGRYELILNLKGGSRVNPDAELIAALPTEMREAMRRLQLRGPVSVRGQTQITLPDSDVCEPIIDWNVAMQLEGNRIADAGPVHSLRGEILVKGSRNEHGIRASGDVAIDSMHVDDLHITSIVGPFTIVDDVLKLGLKEDGGFNAEGDLSQPVRTIQGKIFDGRIDLRGDLQLASGTFDVDVNIRDAKVPTILADLGHVDNELSGLFSGNARFEGSLGTLDFLKGNGKGQVTKANLYQLPMIVQVLNQLSIKPTEDVAFTDGTVQFTMFGDTVNFTELKMWGDWVALHGSGSLDGRRELDLSFNTRVSPQNVFTQVIRPLRGEKYTLWTIDVKGPLHAPTIERRAFEGVGETLERFIPTMTSGEPEPIAEKPKRGIGSWFR